MNPDSIYIHCSATDNPLQDSAEAIRILHMAPSWRQFKWGKYLTTGKEFTDIGYHSFIAKSGQRTAGRPETIQGAHCYGYNKNSLAVCVSGENEFTPMQMRALRVLVWDWQRTYNIADNRIFGHCDRDPNKTCPNFNYQEALEIGKYKI